MLNLFCHVNWKSSRIQFTVQITDFLFYLCRSHKTGDEHFRVLETKYYTNHVEHSTRQRYDHLHVCCIVRNGYELADRQQMAYCAVPRILRCYEVQVFVAVMTSGYIVIAGLTDIFSYANYVYGRHVSYIC